MNKSKSLTQRRKPRWHFRPIYLLILAWLVGTLFPYLWMAITSITPREEFSISTTKILPTRATLAAYSELFSRTPFLKYVGNSLFVAALTVASVIVISLLAGTALSRYRFRGRMVVLYGILLVQLLPVVLLIVPLYIELKTLGLLNSKLGLVLVYTTFATPFSTWLMKGFVDQLPVEVEEAAMIDGCSRFQTFIYVTLPLTRPGIAAAGTYAFIYAWNEYLIARTITSGPETKTLPVGLSLFIGENMVRWDFLTAGGVLAAIPILIGFMLAQKGMVSGLSSGAVKG